MNNMKTQEGSIYWEEGKTYSNKISSGFGIVRDMSGVISKIRGDKHVSIKPKKSKVENAVIDRYNIKDIASRIENMIAMVKEKKQKQLDMYRKKAEMKKIAQREKARAKRREMLETEEGKMMLENKRRRHMDALRNKLIAKAEKDKQREERRRRREEEREKAVNIDVDKVLEIQRIRDEKEIEWANEVANSCIKYSRKSYYEKRSNLKRIDCLAKVSTIALATGTSDVVVKNRIKKGKYDSIKIGKDYFIFFKKVTDKERDSVVRKLSKYCTETEMIAHGVVGRSLYTTSGLTDFSAINVDGRILFKKPNNVD